MTRTNPRHRLGRRRLLGLLTGTALAGTVLAGTAQPATSANAHSRADTVLRQLRSYASSPDDPGSLRRVAGRAEVVGIGEASHSAHQSLELKTETFGALTRIGFRTFALEVSWSTGQALDRWVAGGPGRLGDIMDRDFQGQYLFWNTAEYEQLFTWMRARNAHGAGLHVAGVDLGYPGPALFDRVVTALAANGHDGLAERLRGSRPDPDRTVADWMAARLADPVAVRQQQAATARQALEVLQRCGARADLVQDARAIAQSFTAYAVEDSRFRDRMRYRDETMARNILWWLGHRPGRILFASSNTHVGYRSDDPQTYPVTVGQQLHRTLGRDYVAIGTTIGRGRIYALPDPASAAPAQYAVPPAGPDHTEHQLDRIGRDALLDLRHLPPASREWFAQVRPVRNYGLYWSEDPVHLSLGTTFDALVHHRIVTPGRLR